MESIIEIISLVVSILTIVLFFKVWGMTNDIRKIRDIFIAASIKQVDIKVGDIVVHREFNEAMEVLEINADKITCRALNTNDEFTLKKEEFFVINQK